MTTAATRFISYDPRTGSEVARFPELSATDATDLLSKVHGAYENEWRETSAPARAKLLRRCGELFRERLDTLSALLVDEVGKPLDQARKEVEKCAWFFEWYADNGPRILEDEVIDVGGDAAEAVARKEPKGVVLFVQPYNYALFQVVRALAPILMAGNAVLLKHSSTVPRCALALEETVAAAGVPANVFRNAFISSGVAMELMADRRVRAGTLTGSFRAGSGFGEVAGRHTKPCVLELGGNDPYLVLEDADIDLAVRTTVASRFQNNSQSCIACKRILVHSSIAPAFTERFVAAVSALKVGDPREPGTDLGPLASRALRDEVASQVAKSVSQGSFIALGGEIPAGEVGGPGSGGGFYYMPTVLTGVAPGQEAFDEEIFGPVAAISTFETVDEAVELANRSRYGLGAGVFSRNVDAAKAVAARLDCGMTFVNSYVKSDPRVPFGGVKDSGIGRECGRWGMLAFCNIKTLWVAK